jgi:hypothetical protein
MVPRSPCKASVGCRKTLRIPNEFIVATTFLQILPLFPTPLTTSFPLHLMEFEIALTALARPSWATVSVSYKSSRAVNASRSILMTCKAVFKTPWLVEFSIDPASDIAVDELEDVGVSGRWNIEMEAIVYWCLLCECVIRPGRVGFVLVLDRPITATQGARRAVEAARSWTLGIREFRWRLEQSRCEQFEIYRNSRNFEIECTKNAAPHIARIS